MPAKQVYVPFGTDVFHHGHAYLIEKASELGEVTIGLLTDEAIASFKRYPLLNYEQREAIIKSMKGVVRVVPQQSPDLTDNLLELKPDVVVHGEDWKNDKRRVYRNKTLEALKEWNGELVEPKLLEGVSATQLAKVLAQEGVTPNQRMKKLRELMNLKPLVRILEAHNGLTGRIVETVKVEDEMQTREFDGMWCISLTDSTAK